MFKKFDIGSDKVSHMIGIGKTSNDKLGLGFKKSETSSAPKKTTFVKGSQPVIAEVVNAPKRFIPVCHHCGVKGHIRPFCRELRNHNIKRSKNGSNMKVKSESVMNQEGSVLFSIKATLEKTLLEFSRLAKLMSQPQPSKSSKEKTAWVKKLKPTPRIRLRRPHHLRRSLGMTTTTQTQRMRRKCACYPF